MLVVLASILGVIAAGALLVIIAALAWILRLAPVGQRQRVLQLLLRWQFGAVRHIAGDRVVRPINFFSQAVMLFLGVIACAVALGAAQFINGQGAPADSSGLSSFN